jgi:hypothetical protein
MEGLQQEKYGFVLYGEGDEAYAQTALWPSVDPPGYVAPPPAKAAKVHVGAAPSPAQPARPIVVAVAPVAVAAPPPAAVERPKSAVQLLLEKKKHELTAGTK